MRRYRILALGTALTAAVGFGGCFGTNPDLCNPIQPTSAGQVTVTSQVTITVPDTTPITICIDPG